MILDGTALSRELFGEVLAPRELLVRMYPALETVVPRLDQVVLTATPLTARVNNSTWIASCDCGVPSTKIPTPGGVVFFEGPGAGFVWCMRCQNGGTGRGWRPVLVPSPESRAAIESVLALRPNHADRNWEPHETIADLIAQNLAHGDPIPTPDEPPAAAPAPVPTGPRWPSDAARAVLERLKRRPFLAGLRR